MTRVYLKEMQARTARKSGRLLGLKAGGAAILVATVILSAMTLTANDSSARVAATPICKDFYFVNARGSGEKANKGSLFNDKSRRKDILAGSPSSQAVFNSVLTAVERTHANPTFQVYNLNYPADSIWGMGRAAYLWYTTGYYGKLQKEVAKYLKNERQAEGGFAQAINQIESDCSSVGKTRKIVLAGYSQGAMALHNYLVSLQDENPVYSFSRQDEPGGGSGSAIVGAVLVADPERLPESQVANYGSAPYSANSFGICHLFETAPQFARPSCLADYATIEDIPPSFSDFTYQLCDFGDPACDFSETALVGGPIPGGWIHTQNYKDPNRLQQPSSLIASRITPETDLGLQF